MELSGNFDFMLNEAKQAEKSDSDDLKELLRKKEFSKLIRRTDPRYKLWDFEEIVSMIPEEKQHIVFKDVYDFI